MRQKFFSFLPILLIAVVLQSSQSKYYPEISEHVFNEVIFLTKDSVRYNMENLNEKPTYIGFWATYSRPSIKQFIDFDKLNKEYNGEINFVTVAIGKSFREWVEYCDTMPCSGEKQLYLYEKTRGKLKKLTGLSKPPHYTMLDQNGKILESSAREPKDMMKIMRLYLK